MQRRKLEELSLMDDFLFNAMLTHPETGEKFTNKILKLLFNREFKNLKVSAQKVYAGMNTDLRGARLDVCIEGDCVSIEGDEIPSVYDVEPDQNNKATENMVWLKPYKKAPRMQAERAYKKRDYKEFVVIRKSYGDKILSESVKYVISLKNTDINGNMSWETIFAIPLEKSILLNKTICGYNAINYSGKTSCGKLKKIICKQFGIDSNAIFIEKI